MMRTNYRNGDEIGLIYNGCDGCHIEVINGVILHELDCPYAYKDYLKECYECGEEFYPSDRYQILCNDCQSNMTEYWEEEGWFEHEEG